MPRAPGGSGQARACLSFGSLVLGGLILLALGLLAPGTAAEPTVTGFQLSATEAYRGDTLTANLTGFDPQWPNSTLRVELKVEPGLWGQTGSYDLQNGIKGLVTSENGDRTVVATWDGRVILFDELSRPVWSKSLPYAVQSLDMTPDGELVVAGTGSGDIYCWNASTELLKWDVTLPGGIAQLRVSASGYTIIAATGDSDHTVYQLRGVDGHVNGYHYRSARINALDLSRDGKYYVAGSDDNRVYLYQRGLNGGEPVGGPFNMGSVVEAVDISDNGQVFAMGDYQGDLEVHSINQSQHQNQTQNRTELLWELNLEHGSISSMELSADGDRLGVLAGDRLYYFFEVAQRYTMGSQIPMRVERLAASPGVVDLSSDGKLLTAATITSGYHFYALTPGASSPLLDMTLLSPTSLSGLALADSKNTLILANSFIDSGTWGYLRRYEVQELLDRSELQDDLWRLTLKVPLASRLDTYELFTRLVNPDEEHAPWSKATTSLTFGNRPPSPTILPEASALGTLYDTVAFTLQGNITDLDGGSNYYQVEWWLDELLYAYSTQGPATTTPPVKFEGLTAGQHNLTLRVWDSSNQRGNVSRTFLVHENVAPRVQQVELDDPLVYRGRNFSLDVRGGDDLSDPLDLGLEFGFKERELMLPVQEQKLSNGNLNLQFSSSGRYLLVRTSWDKVYMFDTLSRSHTLYDSPTYISRSEVVGDLEYLVLVEGSRLKVLELPSLQTMWVSSSYYQIQQLTVSADGSTILFVSKNTLNQDQLYLFSVQGSEPVWTYNTDTQVDQVFLSPDGRYITAYLVDWDRMDLYWREAAEPLFWLPLTSRISYMQYSDEGEYLLVGLEDGRAMLFETTSPVPVWQVGSAEYPVSELKLSPDGEHILVSVSVNQLNSVLLYQRGSDIPVWVRYDLTEKLGFPFMDLTTDGQSVMLVEQRLDSGLTYVLKLSRYANELRWVKVLQGEVTDRQYDQRGNIYLKVLDQAAETTRLVKLEAASGREAWSVFLAHRDTRFKVNSQGTEVLLRGPYSMGLLEASSGTRVWYLDGSFDTGEQALNHFGLSGDGLHFAGYLHDPDNASPHRLVIFESQGLFSLGVPRFEAGAWHLNVSVRLHFKPGSYTPGVRLMDPLGAVGEWCYSNTTLQVLNNPPVARLEDLERLNQGESLAGSGTDLDGTIVGYRWSSRLKNPLSFKALLDTGLLAPGDQRLGLQVQDDDGSWSGPAYLEFHLNGRPVAQLLGWPVTPVLRGEWVTLSGEGEDVDSPLPIALQRWEVGPLRLTRAAGQPLELDTSLLQPGNHSLRYLVQDLEGAWSLPQVGWLHVNGPPRARIMGVYVTRLAENDVVTLWGNGTDEDTVSLFQWRSDRDGFLGMGEVLVLDNLSGGSHVISMRVKDPSGLWSSWVIYPQPLEVAGHGSGDWPPAFLSERRFYTGLLLSYLLFATLWVGSRPWRNRWLARQVKEPTLQVWDLQNRFIARGLELEFPRQHLGRAFEPLTRGRYWKTRRRLEQLEDSVSSTLELFERCFRLRKELEQLVARTPKTRLRAYCPPRRLERLEYLYLVRRLAEYQDQTTQLIGTLKGVRHSRLGRRSGYSGRRRARSLGRPLNGMDSRRDLR